MTLAPNSYCAPGKVLHKIWRVRNVGAAPWPANTTVSFVSGDLPPVATDNAPPALSSVPAPGETTNVSVQFRVPVVPGKYRASYRVTVDGVPMSDFLDIYIVVPADTASSAPSK